MLRPFAAACVLSFLVPAVRPSAQADDAARLVPGDAAILVRVESVRAWNELVRAFAPLAGEAAATHDLQAVLDGMARGAEAAAGTPPRLDPARPLYLAVSLDPTAGPIMTLVAPVTNGQPFRFPADFGPTTNVVQGSYTGVSNRAGYAASANPNRMLAALAPGLVSVHVDLETLVTAYRPLIDMGLAQFEVMLDQAPAGDEMPFDVQPLMDVYLDAARAIVDGADALDVALERRGAELALRFDYVEREERAGTGAVADVAPLLGYVDPECSAQIVLNGKWTDYTALFETVTDAVVEVYPEPLRSDVRKLLALQGQVEPLLLPGLAAGFDVGGSGMRGTYVMRSSRPAELQARIESLLRELDHPGGVLRVGTAQTGTIDGLEARVLPIELQHDVLVGALKQMSAASGGLPSDAEQQFRATMEALYGRNLVLAFVPRGDILGLCLAGDDTALRAGVARLRAPAAPAPELLGLARRIRPGALGFAYQLDFGRSMGQMFTALSGVLPDAGSFPTLPASFGFWGSHGGRVWSGGTVMSITELLDFAPALMARERR